jgi:hypothetical protein
MPNAMSGQMMRSKQSVINAHRQLFAHRRSARHIRLKIMIRSPWLFSGNHGTSVSMLGGDQRRQAPHIHNNGQAS